MQNHDLQILKMRYGERFSRLCRELFPTLLETENLLPTLLEEKFGAHNHFLYEDIVNNKLTLKFQTFICGLVTRKETKKIVTNRSPESLLDEAGYVLYPECRTEEEIQAFKKYYADGERLCTFHGGRLDTCRVWFAVKKNVDSIKRTDFQHPNRQDEYGTSVISIQFSKGPASALSIKNRYNSKVINPDATFGNNLDSIVPGLSNSFEIKYDIVFEGSVLDFEIPNYVIVNGKFYKYNFETYNVYYCPNNMVIDNGTIRKFDTDSCILADRYIFDFAKKQIIRYDGKSDSFLESIDTKYNDIKKMYIKNIGDSRQIIVEQNKGKKVVVQLDGENNISGYFNENAEKIGDSFLYGNRKLKTIELPNVISIGERFLFCNLYAEKVKFPKVENIKESFLYNNLMLKEIDLPKLNYIEKNFMYCNWNLKKFNVHNLDKSCYENLNDHFKYLIENKAEKYNKLIKFSNKNNNTPDLSF